ncbi:MAG: glutamate--tRNA ligase [archaeon]
MLEKEMQAYALKNAIDHGSAVVGKVLPKLFNHGLDKKDIGKVMPELNKIIGEVNKMSASEREKKFEEFKEFVKERDVKEKDLPELETHGKKVVVRFKPSPSGPLSIGHAFVLGLNYLLAKKYNGELLLGIDDTNADNIEKDAYEMIPKDADWLTSKGVNGVYVQSDNMETYYAYANELFEKGELYVCTCDPEKFKELINKKKACPCRELSVEEQKGRWNKMFDSYKKGEAVVRLKTDIKDKNPAMRDFPLFRINDTKHVRQGTKYRVWPLMNFAVAIDDLKTGVTHVLRGADHADNAKRQAKIHALLGVKTPDTLFFGRINFLGMPLSTTKMKEDIRAGKYSGWDDIRLPTLLALRRRGYTAESLLRYAFDIGVTLHDKTVSKDEFFQAINAHNRVLIDSEVNRYFFVANPKKIKIEGVEGERVVEIPLHPSFPKKGRRKLHVKSSFYLADEIEKGKTYRLMHLFNFKNEKFVSNEVDDKLKAKMVHWLPADDKNVRVRVLMEDGSWVLGLGESDLKKIKKNQVVQFERFGFAILDGKSKDEMLFWFLHK